MKPPRTSPHLLRVWSGWFGPGASNTYLHKARANTQAFGSSPLLPHFVFAALRFRHGLRLRLARLQHAEVGRRGAASMGTTSSTMASALGVRARQTDAGALPPPTPDTARPWATTCSEGDATCSSSSRIGSRGSPTSSGTNPQVASPSVAFCPGPGCGVIQGQAAVSYSGWLEASRVMA